MSDELRNLVEPEVVGMTTEYLRKLIIESPYIRAKLLNPGASVVLLPVAATTEQQQEHSSQIGNPFHLDLIEAEQILQKRFSKEDRRLLYDWALGLKANQVADYFGVTGSLIRKRRQRAVEKLKKELDGRKQPRGTSDSDTSGRRSEKGVEPEKGRNTRRAQVKGSKEKGVTDEYIREG